MRTRTRNNSARKAVDRLNATMSALSDRVLGRDDLIRQIKFALITKNHVLMEGPPGVAKSMLANLLFRAIRGHKHYFDIKCTKKMSEDYLVGAPDMRKFRQEGRLWHLTDKTLVTSDFAFIDEFMDLTPGALRALLELLNERTFTRGRQKEKSPLWTALAATNFSGENEEALEAVIDRFLFRCKVEPLSSIADRMRMIKASVGQDEEMGPIPVLNKADIVTLNKQVSKVYVTDLVMETYLAVCDKIGSLTDRTIANAIRVVQANAMLEGRYCTSVKDLNALDCVFRVPGDSASSSRFAKAFSVYKGALDREKRISNVFMIYRRISDLVLMIQDCEDYKEAYAIAHEAREAEQAIHALSTSDTEHLKTEGCKSCCSILEKADTLYNRDKD
ncbi:MAG: AAA domain-containing protein [Candidatus Altiarchaeales archaeon]|nr:AAA domain-containing protein [Candidatus Altiarchaeales archaeon]